jgi:hypothetical protein
MDIIMDRLKDIGGLGSVWFAGLLIGLAFAVPVRQAVGQDAKGLVFSGESSTDGIYSVAEPWSGSAAWDSGKAYKGLSSFRLDARGGDRQSSKVEASVVVRLVYGAAAEPIVLFDAKKLYASVYMERADLSVGRMIVNYGRGTVFSPVDLFAAVDTGDLALGRVGTDAVRLFIPLGDLSGLDLVGTLAKPPAEAILGGRGSASIEGWDMGLSLYRDGGDQSRLSALVFGLDLKGDIEVGLSAEALARIPWGEAGFDGGSVAFSTMAGLDYSVSGTWFFDFEYLANFGGGRAAGTFLGAHTLFGSLSYKVDELTTIDARSLWNPGEKGWQASLAAGRSIAPGSQLLFYTQYSSGDVRANSAYPPRSAAAQSPAPQTSTSSAAPGSGSASVRDLLSFGLRLSVAF